MTHPIRFALVGCGRIGSRHIGHIPKYGRLVAACDSVPEQLSAAELPEECRPFNSVDEMLAEMADAIDVVSICTPNGLHAEHSIKCLSAGTHVLCEKPMALTTRDCGRMIEAAERANRRLFIVKQNRYNPPVQAVKDLLDRNVLGRISSIHLNCYWNRNDAYYADSWKGSRQLDGGTLYTQFSHFIDLLYWFAGDVLDVDAYVDNFQHGNVIEFEDSGVAILKFHGGTLGTVSFNINSHGKNMEGSITLFGEKGTIKVGGQYLNELEYQNIEEHEVSGLPPGNPPNEYGQYQGSMSNHHLVYENLVQVLEGSGVIGTHGFEGLKTVEIIEKIYAAAAQRH